MSHTMTALASAGPVAAAWSVHSLWMRQRVEMARRDPLTGLITRAAFTERAESSVRRSPERIAVYVIDLDGFKQVNDTYSHAAGDAILAATGRRLAGWAKLSRGYVARLGGDEFAALTTVTDREHLVSQAERLHHMLTRPVQFEDASLAVGASIGALRCTGQAPGTDPLSVLLRRADEAMYAAKQNGGGTFLADTAQPMRGTVNGRRQGRSGTHGTHSGTEAAA